MLAAFDRIQVSTEQKITQADHEFCRQQQKLLYATLDQLMKWYDLFRKDAEQYIESHRPSFEPSGKVETHECYNDGDKIYSEYEFLPFTQINTIVKNYSKACGISLTGLSAISTSSTTFLFQPQISTTIRRIAVGLPSGLYVCVEIVFDHLGGRGFREKAEDEIIDRCLEAVRKTEMKCNPNTKGKPSPLPRCFVSAINTRLYLPRRSKAK